MNAHIETIKRNTPPRFNARRAANWSVLMVALSQTACDEDPDPWATVDGGADASVTADGGAADASSEGVDSQTSTLPAETLTVGIESTNVVAYEAGVLDASATESRGPDASASEATTALAATSETLPTASEVVTETSAPNTATSVVSSSGGDVTSAPDATQTSVASDGETTASEPSSQLSLEPSDAGAPDAAAPPLEVCGAVIDDSQAISLAQALENYTVPDAGGGDGGGALADCYPPCIAALLNACPVTSSQCTIGAGHDACWDNGVSQRQTYDDSDPYLFIVTEDAYNGNAPCISGTVTTDLSSFVSTYVWRDGTGAQVATGTDASEELVVTCADDNQEYTVDKYACPELGQVVYTQFSCGYSNEAR